MRKWLILCLVFVSIPLVAGTTTDLFERAKAESDLHAQIELLTQVIAQSPRHVGAYHYRADAYQALGNSRRAILDYDKVIALRPKDPFRYYARGLAYSTMGNYSLAAADFSKAISLRPTYVNFYLARARAYRSLGKYTLSLKDYQTYGGENWKQAGKEVLYEAIPVSLEAFRYDQANAQLKALQTLGEDSPQLYVWQGRVLQSENKLDEAISAFSKAANRNTEWVQAYQFRGNAFKELGDYSAALEDYTRVLALDPQAYWFNRRGLVYEELQDFENASEDYSRAIERDSQWAVAYNNRGFAQLNLHNYAAAKADFEKAIKLDPSAPTPYVNLAGVYWTHKKDRKHMYENLEKALEHNFKNFEVLFDDNQKGWLFKGVNRTAEFRSLLYK